MIEVIIAFLLVFILIREYLFYKTTKDLTDKIVAFELSSSYHEYSDGMSQMEKAKKKPKEDINRMVRV